MSDGIGMILALIIIFILGVVIGLAVATEKYHSDCKNLGMTKSGVEVCECHLKK